jgi:hypothetical protein
VSVNVVGEENMIGRYSVAADHRKNGPSVQSLRI